MDLTNLFYILGTVYFFVTIVFLATIILIMAYFYRNMKGQLERFSQLNLSHYLAVLLLVIKLFSRVMAKKITKKA